MSLGWFLETLKFILCCVEGRPERHDDDGYYVPISNRNRFWGRGDNISSYIHSVRGEPIVRFGDDHIKYHRIERGSLVLDGSTSDKQVERIHHEPHHPSSSSRSPPPSFTYAKSFSKQPSFPSSHSPSPSKPSPLISKPPVTSKLCPISCSKLSISSPHPPSFRTISPVSSKPSQFLNTTQSPLSDGQPKEEVYEYLKDDALPICRIPENIEDLIKKDIVPGVLRQPLTYSTYKDYFATLLYAEDNYIEEWSDFELKNVTLKLHAAPVKRSDQRKRLSDSAVTNKRQFVEFDIDSLIKEEAFKEAGCGKEPMRRPFLLSRDFVLAQPLGRKVEPFKGVVYRVKGKGVVLAEFRDEFLSQHRSKLKYDISFSFNRVCLKRAHQAISDASELLFQHFLSPDHVSKGVISPESSYFRNYPAVGRMLNMPGIPHLVQGPLSIQHQVLSRTGVFVINAVVQVYNRHPESARILICAPENRTCDLLMAELKKDIPEPKMFRANAAFRDVEEVETNILASCLYEGECFVCPPLQVLKEYPVIFSTFMSSYRLHKAGIMAGHFDCMFLVDASFATERESLVVLANFADDRTVVIVTGAPENRPRRVRSDIGRKNGLSISYFERLWCGSSGNTLFGQELEL